VEEGVEMHWRSASTLLPWEAVLGSQSQDPAISTLYLVLVPRAYTQFQCHRATQARCRELWYGFGNFLGTMLGSSQVLKMLYGEGPISLEIHDNSSHFLSQVFLLLNIPGFSLSSL
jgi:hypothetical protein